MMTRLADDVRSTDWNMKYEIHFYYTTIVVPNSTS